MKTLLLALFIFSVAAISSAAEFKSVDLKIEGMTCHGCVSAVEKHLGKVDGVEKVTVTLADNSASVTFDPAKTDEKSLSDAVKEAGFKVVSVEDIVGTTSTEKKGCCSHEKKTCGK